MILIILYFQAFCIAILKSCDAIKSIINRAQVFEEARLYFVEQISSFNFWFCRLIKMGYKATPIYALK